MKRPASDLDEDSDGDSVMVITDSESPTRPYTNRYRASPSVSHSYIVLLACD